MSSKDALELLRAQLEKDVDAEKRVKELEEQVAKFETILKQTDALAAVAEMSASSFLEPFASKSGWEKAAKLEVALAQAKAQLAYEKRLNEEQGRAVIGARQIPSLVTALRQQIAALGGICCQLASDSGYGDAGEGDMFGGDFGEVMHTLPGEKKLKY
jgi:hypothetical protein